MATAQQLLDAIKTDSASVTANSTLLINTMEAILADNTQLKADVAYIKNRLDQEKRDRQADATVFNTRLIALEATNRAFTALLRPPCPYCHVQNNPEFINFKCTACAQNKRTFFPVQMTMNQTKILRYDKFQDA